MFVNGSSRIVYIIIQNQIPAFWVFNSATVVNHRLKYKALLTCDCNTKKVPIPIMNFAVCIQWNIRGLIVNIMINYTYKHRSRKASPGAPPSGLRPCRHLHDGSCRCRPIVACFFFVIYPSILLSSVLDFILFPLLSTRTLNVPLW